MPTSGFVDTVTKPPARERYLAEGLWTAETFAARFAQQAAAHPDRIAVIDREGSRRTTYARLNADAAAGAALLRACGVGVGDVVSVQLPNWYETAVVSVAAHSVGAVVNPLLPAYRVRELGHVLRTARPKVWFSPGIYRGFDYRALAAEVIQECGGDTCHVVVDDECDGGDVGLVGYLAKHSVPGMAVAPADIGADAVSEIIFTSGTEAIPKGVLHTDQTAGFSMRVAYRDLELSERDVVWMPSPVGHSTGYNYGLRFALYHGLPLVLQDRWSPPTAVDLIQAESCSYTLAATTFLQDVIGECARRGAQLESMRCFCCGGAPVPAELVAAGRGYGLQVLRLYGSTEGLVVTVNRPGGVAEKHLHTDGLAMSDVELDVRDEHGRRCPAGTPGEIYLRGPDVCVGFYQDRQRTAAAFTADGWLRSGDLGRLDEDGYVSIVGRKKEIIIRGGLNIAPREVEDLLLTFPEVDRVAIIGLPDERLGERCCACVVLREGFTLDFEHMVSRLRATGLAVYKLPERLVLFDQLPVTPSGKIQKYVIVAGLTDKDQPPPVVVSDGNAVAEPI
jgi:acyl-CoA synthetase (AMP-forming)/AMP-acid ligase II